MNTTSNTDVCLPHPTSWQVCLAAQTGDVVELRRCIALGFPCSIYSDALERAVVWNQAQCVSELIPVTHNYTDAFIQATIYGSVECVALLLPLSNPQTKNSAALVFAAANGHHNCVDALYAVSDVSAALSVLRTNFGGIRKIWIELEDRFEAERQKTELLNSITKPIVVVQRKM